MKHFRHILIGTLLLLTSCIENSIPYPVVTLQILGVEGEGFTCSPEDINTQERIVTLHLDEQTDISNVKIDKISVTENARSSKPLSGTFDLRTPLYLTLSFYQDYEWTIVADQQIERYFEVESQIGALHRTLRKYALDGIWEAFKTINTTNQDVSNTTVLKIRKNFNHAFYIR